MPKYSDFVYNSFTLQYTPFVHTMRLLLYLPYTQLSMLTIYTTDNGTDPCLSFVNFFCCCFCHMFSGCSFTARYMHMNHTTMQDYTEYIQCIQRSRKPQTRTFPKHTICFTKNFTGQVPKVTNYRVLL